MLLPEHLLEKHLQNYQNSLQQHTGLEVQGRLTRLVGMKLEAVGCKAPIGTHCYISTDTGERVAAEIVGFDGEKAFLMCLGNVEGLAPGARVISTGYVADVPVGQAMLSRVIDGAGKPLDGRGPLNTTQTYPLMSVPQNPLQRTPIDTTLDVGVRAINGLLTIGRGQRMGLFAGSGVGKSVLLGMMTRYTEAEIIVVGLIGERGREVKEFIEHSLGPEGLRRSVVVAAPADASPLMRSHGALLATSIAEYYRDQGAHVLLLMDSLTRYAQAHREIGLAIGEPPATKGYPPSVFAKLSQLVERAGNGGPNQGSITAFYTVLTEGDDHNDPIADSARAILDGHIVLSRKIAETGLYPAIDIEASISRVLPQITDQAQQLLLSNFKRIYSKYEQNRDLINIGAYVSGSDPEVDLAIQIMPMMRDFLAQSMTEQASMADSLAHLQSLFNNAPQNIPAQRMVTS